MCSQHCPRCLPVYNDAGQQWPFTFGWRRYFLLPPGASAPRRAPGLPLSTRSSSPRLPSLSGGFDAEIGFCCRPKPRDMAISLCSFYLDFSSCSLISFLWFMQLWQRKGSPTLRWPNFTSSSLLCMCQKETRRSQGGPYRSASVMSDRVSQVSKPSDTNLSRYCWRSSRYRTRPSSVMYATREPTGKGPRKRPSLGTGGLTRWSTKIALRCWPIRHRPRVGRLYVVQGSSLIVGT